MLKQTWGEGCAVQILQLFVMAVDLGLLTSSWKQKYLGLRIGWVLASDHSSTLLQCLSFTKKQNKTKNPPLFRWPSFLPEATQTRMYPTLDLALCVTPPGSTPVAFHSVFTHCKRTPWQIWCICNIIGLAWQSLCAFFNTHLSHGDETFVLPCSPVQCSSRCVHVLQRRDTL